MDIPPNRYPTQEVMSAFGMVFWVIFRLSEWPFLSLGMDVIFNECACLGGIDLSGLCKLAGVPCLSIYCYKSLCQCLSLVMMKSLVPNLSNVQRFVLLIKWGRDSWFFLDSGWQYINSDISIANEPKWQTDSLATWRNCHAAIFLQRSNRSGVFITASLKRYKAFSSTIAPNVVYRSELSWTESKRSKFNLAHNLSDL